MCRFSDAELNCVSTNIRFRPAWRQLLIGMSISRYLPPIGTAGFDLICVNGNSLAPRPPPRIRVRTSFIAEILLCASPGRGFTHKSFLLGHLTAVSSCLPAIVYRLFTAVRPRDRVETV